jgi:hypothetical protein
MGAAGTTLIAAAVIGFILSDEDYIKLLRDHVIEVLFNPENYRDNDSLMKRWLAITAHLLKGVLPYSYNSAALEIQKQFLTNEKDFHYWSCPY